MLFVFFFIQTIMNPQVLFFKFINKVWKCIEHEGSHHSNVVLLCQDHAGKLKPLLSVQGRDLPLSYLLSSLWDRLQGEKGSLPGRDGSCSLKL